MGLAVVRTRRRKSVRKGETLGYVRRAPRDPRSLESVMGWSVDMRLPLRGWLVTGIISLSSAGALAADTRTPFPPCTTAPTEADRKAAQGAFAAGQGSFNEADYATAITYWRDAYRPDCTAHAPFTKPARAYHPK